MKRTEQELIGISEHLFYEFRMLCDTANELLPGEHPVHGTVHNALVESFTIHFRIFHDFLYGEKKINDDVVAGDFFQDERDWTENRPDKPESFSDDKRRVCKDAVHLTYTRLERTPETKGWHYLDMAKEVIKKFDGFLILVPKKLLHESWNSYLKEKSIV